MAPYKNKRGAGLPESTRVEVIIKKEMTVKEYYEVREQVMADGFHCQAYQLGYYQGHKETEI